MEILGSEFDSLAVLLLLMDRMRGRDQEKQLPKIKSIPRFIKGLFSLYENLIYVCSIAQFSTWYKFKSCLKMDVYPNNVCALFCVEVADTTCGECTMKFMRLLCSPPAPCSRRRPPRRRCRRWPSRPDQEVFQR